MKTFRISRWPIIAVFTLAVPLLVQAKPPAEIVTGNGRMVEPGPYASQAMEVDVDPSGAVSGRGQLNLVLPNGESVKLERSGFQRRSSASAVWRGKSPQYDESEAVITVQNGLMVGRIVLDNQVYMLQPGARGKHVLQELDTEAFPDCDSTEDQLVAMEGEPTGGEVSAAGEGTGTVIDLLSVYTPRVSSRLGGQAAAEAMIQAAVDNANAAFANSSMAVQYRLVHAAEVNYVTAGTTTDDLYWVTGDAGVAALRDQFGADMVSVIVDTDSSCGTGWVQRNPSAGFQSYAFQATDMDCAVGNLTFAHEHGHNMGMEHNSENSSVGATPENASYEFSFAHYIDGSYRTVMSYSAPCSRGCSRVTRHSNPQSSYAGTPTGVSGARDNAQTGGLTAPIVSAFRDSAVLVEPGLNKRVVQSADDVTENTATGEIYLTDPILAIGDDASQGSSLLGGLRFNEIAVPAGASITRAYLEFVAAASITASATAELSVVNSSNAQPFVNSAYDLSSRSLSSPVLWTMSTWTNGGSSRTPDVSNLIQTVVDQPGWTSGGSIALVLNVSGGRTAYSYDGQPSQAPLLHIEFSEGEPATNLAPSAAFTVQAADLIASFSDNSSDPDGSVTNWNWSFGDGNTAGVRNPSHAYQQGGIYQVSLEVMDDQGATHSTSQDITVLAPELQVLEAPTNFTATIQKSGKGRNKIITEVTLSWQHDISLVDFLVVEGCLESTTGKGKHRQINCDWSVMAASVPGETSSIPAPLPEADYRYRIKAVNTLGASAWSNEVKI